MVGGGRVFHCLRDVTRHESANFISRLVAPCWDHTDQPHLYVYDLILLSAVRFTLMSAWHRQPSHSQAALMLVSVHALCSFHCLAPRLRWRGFSCRFPVVCVMLLCRCRRWQASRAASPLAAGNMRGRTWCGRGYRFAQRSFEHVQRFIDRRTVQPLASQVRRHQRLRAARLRQLISRPPEEVWGPHPSFRCRSRPARAVWDTGPGGCSIITCGPVRNR